jgi:hypothetical protein
LFGQVEYDAGAVHRFRAAQMFVTSGFGYPQYFPVENPIIILLGKLQFYSEQLAAE